MRKFTYIAASLCAFALLSGCDSAKSPEAVKTDVDAAREKSAADIAKTEQSAAKDADSAAAKVDDKQKDLDAANAKGAYDVAVAKADGDRRVAVEKCMVLAGDQQKACKDQATAKHDLAVANAEAIRAAQKP